METIVYGEMSGMSGFAREGRPGETARASERGVDENPRKVSPWRKPDISDIWMITSSG
jgi:hypothetical protein